MNNKPLVVFAIPSLVGGGAERVVVNLANQFSCNGYGVHILLLSGDKSSPYASQIDDRVEIVSLRSKQKQYNIFLKMLLVFPLLCKLMKYFQRHKPALIFANLCAPQIILASSLSETNPPVVIIEHSVAFPPNSVKTIRNRVIHILMACSYPKARKFVGVSRGVMNDFLSRGYVFVDQVTYIYNPIITTQIRKAIENKKNFVSDNISRAPIFLSMGRLEEAKNFPLLLQAFKLIKERSNAKLLIAGNGSLKVSLENFANELEVSEDVEFLGFVENPYELFCKADVFVLSSSWEGLGNVIIEALACGCQVVSTDCPGGPAEILENGKYGRLVPVGNARALADAMLEAYRKPFPKEMLMKRAEDFDEEVIGHQYIQLAEEILANAP